MTRRLNSQPVSVRAGGWIQVVTTDDQLGAIVTSSVGGHAEVVTTSGPSLDWARAPTATVVGGATVGAEFVGTMLQHLRRLGLTHTSVVVAPISSVMATTIARHGCLHVVSWERAGEDLPGLLLSLVRSGPRHSIWRRLTSRVAGDIVLADAIDAALSSDVPVGSVQTLAVRAAWSPATIRDHWRSSALPGSPIWLVHMSLLCHLAEERSRGVALETVVRRLPVHASTMTRISRRYFGRPLRELTLTTLSHLLDREGI